MHRRITLIALAITIAVTGVAAPPAAALTGSAIILDTASPGYTETGTWTDSGLAAAYSASSRFEEAGAGGTATWRPNIPQTGSYDVYVWFPVHANRATNAPFTVVGSTSQTVQFNQRTQGPYWNFVGTYQFVAGTTGYVRLTAATADGIVSADAVAFVPAGDPVPDGPPLGDLQPVFRQQQLITNGNGTNLPFLAFPTVLRISDQRALVTYKKGTRHCDDLTGAVLETVVYNPTTQQVLSRAITAQAPGVIYQNVQYVPMPNGDIYLLADRQDGCGTRLGLESLVSIDDGQSFTSEGDFPTVNGVPYGYAFDYVRDGSIVYLMLMTFADIGGPGRQVHVIKTEDSGATWEFVANITANVGVPINESTFEQYGTGWIVVARKDGAAAGVAYRTDEDFMPLAEVDLTAAYPTVRALSRPRLMTDGNDYFLMAKSDDTATAALKLHHLEPDTLRITATFELAESFAFDAFYSEGYLQDRSGRTYLDVMVHEPQPGDSQNIYRYSFRWDELKLRLMDDFEDATLGTTPAGWTVTGNGTFAVVSAGAGQRARLAQTSAGTPVAARHALSATADLIAAEFQLTPSQVTAGFEARLGTSAGTPAAHVGIDTTGRLYAGQGGSKVDIGGYVAGQPIPIKVVADPGAQSYDVEVHGALLAQDVPFAVSTTTLGQMTFASVGATAGTVEIDHVMVH